MSLHVIPKKDWGGALSRGPLQIQHPSKITFHHQGPEPGFENIHQISCYEGNATIRKIQKQHMIDLGLADIKYHYVIDPEGKVFEGRPPHCLGKHVNKNNRDNIGVLVIGNFKVEQPTAFQIASIKNLCVYISFLFPNINLPKCIFGHRDFDIDMETCPGDNLYNIISDLKYGIVSLFD